MINSQFGRLPARQIIPVKIYESERKAAVWEQAVFVLWFFALFLPLPEFGAIRYGCIAVTLGLFFWHNRETVPLLLKSWPLLLVPSLGLLSIFWTGYPEAATRIGILLMMAPIFLVTIAARLRAAEFLRVLMLGGMLAVIYCVPYYATLPEGGPYAQKNILAYQMMMVSLISLSVGLRSEEISVLRVIALVTAGVAFAFQLTADSATSLVLNLVGAAVLVGVKIVWDNAAKVTHLRFAVFATVVIAVLSILLVLMMLPQNTLIEDFLGLVGKDATLTGRTDIWIAAEQAAAENPWFGVGLEGFWQPNTGLAQTLAELTHKDPGTNISFHSAFWEMRVHLGFVGLGFYLFAISWAGLRTLNLWLKDGSIVNTTYLLFFLFILASGFTESYAAGAFSPMVALLYFGGIAAFQSGERKLVGTAHLVEQEA